MGTRALCGGMTWKPWASLTPDPEMARALDRQCRGGHVHVPLEGKDPLNSGFYPAPMVRRIASAILAERAWPAIVGERGSGRLPTKPARARASREQADQASQLAVVCVPL